MGEIIPIWTTKCTKKNKRERERERKKDKTKQDQTRYDKTPPDQTKHHQTRPIPEKTPSSYQTKTINQLHFVLAQSPSRVDWSLQLVRPEREREKGFHNSWRADDKLKIRHYITFVSLPARSVFIRFPSHLGSTDWVLCEQTMSFPTAVCPNPTSAKGREGWVLKKISI